MDEMTDQQKAQAYVDSWWEKELNKMNVKENKMKEQDKRMEQYSPILGFRASGVLMQKELDKQLDEQLAETIKLVRKLEEVTEDNQLTTKETRFLIDVTLKMKRRLETLEKRVQELMKETRFLIERRCL